MAAIPDPAKSFEKASGESATVERGEGGRFLKGVGGRSPGRPRGSRVKLGEKFFTALQADFEEHGVEAIARVRFLRPDVYVSVIAKLMPQKIEITTPTDGLTDEQLEQMLAYAEARIVEARTIEGTAIDVTPKTLAAPAPFDDGPTRKADQEREALRVDLHAQHSAIEAVGAVKQALPSIPHPVGKPFPTPDHVVERRNRAKLDDIDPASLF